MMQVGFKNNIKNFSSTTLISIPAIYVVVAIFSAVRGYNGLYLYCAKAEVREEDIVPLVRDY